MRRLAWLACDLALIAAVLTMVIGLFLVAGSLIRK